MATFSRKISSRQLPDGSRGRRKYTKDYAGILERAEILSDAKVTSSDVNTLSVDTVSYDGSTVSFWAECQAEVDDRLVPLDVLITGNSGTEETFEEFIQVVDVLRA